MRRVAPSAPSQSPTRILSLLCSHLEEEVLAVRCRDAAQALETIVRASKPGTHQW